MVKCFNLLKADNIQNDFGILISWQRDTAAVSDVWIIQNISQLALTLA